MMDSFAGISFDDKMRVIRKANSTKSFNIEKYIGAYR